MEEYLEKAKYDYLKLDQDIYEIGSGFRVDIAKMKEELEKLGYYVTGWLRNDFRENGFYVKTENITTQVWHTSEGFCLSTLADVYDKTNNKIYKDFEIAVIL